MPVIRTLPGWPRGMPEWMAAGYVGLSASLLREQTIRRTRLTDGRVVYLREHLDAWLDAKAGIVKAEAYDFDHLFK